MDTIKQGGGVVDVSNSYMLLGVRNGKSAIPGDAPTMVINGSNGYMPVATDLQAAKEQLDLAQWDRIFFDF
ncbi:MAG: hypothetical protein HQL56_08945 [Magnetococcales bacterium]|nr:hypothetical protein [Magnetococcales bacterium]